MNDAVTAITEAAAKARAWAVRAAIHLTPAPRTGVGFAVRTAVEPLTGNVFAKIVMICALRHSATGGA